MLFNLVSSGSVCSGMEGFIMVGKKNEFHKRMVLFSLILAIEHVFS